MRKVQLDAVTASGSPMLLKTIRAATSSWVRIPRPPPYVDEIGDRGHSGQSSPYFAFAAVLVADENEAGLRAAMSRLRREFKTPHV